MDTYLDSCWEEFEVWIRRSVGSDSRQKIRPLDNPSNRKMIAGLNGFDTGLCGLSLRSSFCQIEARHKLHRKHQPIFLIHLAFLY